MTKREWATEVQIEFEKLAIELAQSRGFDYKKESSGLFRAYLMAMTHNEGELLKRAGQIVAERHPGEQVTE